MTFSLTTADPEFDPRVPLTVNGFLFVPADGVPAGGHVHHVLTDGRRAKAIVEVKRRKLVERV
jgi:hypothetical protein